MPGIPKRVGQAFGNATPAQNDRNGDCLVGGVVGEREVEHKAQLSLPRFPILVEMCEEAVETTAVPALAGRRDEDAPFGQAIQNVDWDVTGNGSVPESIESGRVEPVDPFRPPPGSDRGKKRKKLNLLWGLDRQALMGFPRCAGSFCTDMPSSLHEWPACVPPQRSDSEKLIACVFPSRIPAVALVRPAGVPQPICRWAAVAIQS